MQSCQIALLPQKPILLQQSPKPLYKHARYLEPLQMPSAEMSDRRGAAEDVGVNKQVPKLA
jgi:hypothetical protein